MAKATAEELLKLISTAVDSAGLAEADAAEADRAVGALKQLQKCMVTAALLKETEAGKRVNKLSKHGVPSISSAAATVVQSWRECVKREQESKGGGISGGAFQRAGSFASSDPMTAGTASGRVPSSSNLADASSSQQSQQQQQSSASTPSKGSKAAAAPVAPPPKSGNVKRDKARQMMLDGLVLCLSEDVEPVTALGRLAAEVEDALWAANCEGARDPTPAYLSKVRTVAFNLKDPNNPDLRSRVAVGIVPPEALAHMGAEEMASDARKVQNAQIRKEMAAELVRGQQEMATTDQFQCGKCKQRKVTYYQLQTRSADEPMTNFCTCTVCGNRWKFC